MTCHHARLVGRVVVIVVAVLLCSPAFVQTPDPQEALPEGQRLASLGAWTKAEPLYSEAERIFAARGDERTPYARINSLRGRLPEVSSDLEDHRDDHLRWAVNHRVGRRAISNPACRLTFSTRVGRQSGFLLCVRTLEGHHYGVGTNPATL